MKKIVWGLLLAAASSQIAVAQTPSDTALRSVDQFSSIANRQARSVALFEEAGKVKRVRQNQRSRS